jgi:hypothetical protein
MYANPHAHIFQLAGNTGIKKSGVKNPCIPPIANRYIYSSFVAPCIYVHQQANRNSIRQNGGFSVIDHAGKQWQRPNIAYPKVYASPSARGSGNTQTT